MDSPLLKYSAKEYFFKAALCHFCIDMLNAKVGGRERGVGGGKGGAGGGGVLQAPPTPARRRPPAGRAEVRGNVPRLHGFTRMQTGEGERRGAGRAASSPQGGRGRRIPPPRLPNLCTGMEPGGLTQS